MSLETKINKYCLKAQLSEVHTQYILWYSFSPSAVDDHLDGWQPDGSRPHLRRQVESQRRPAQKKHSCSISVAGKPKGQISVDDSLRLVADVHARRQDASPFSEALHSVPRDHHAVVGAEFGGRAEQLQPRCVGNDAQRLADVLVTGNSSRENLPVGSQTLV